MSFFNYILVLLVIAATVPTLVMSDCLADNGCQGKLCCYARPDGQYGGYCAKCPETCTTNDNCGKGSCCNFGRCGFCSCWNSPKNCNKISQCCLRGSCAPIPQVGESCNTDPIEHQLSNFKCPCQNGSTCGRNSEDIDKPNRDICTYCFGGCPSPEYCCKNGKCFKAPQPGEQCTDSGCPCTDNLQCLVNSTQGNNTCQGDGEGICTTQSDCSASNCCSNGKCLRRPRLDQLCKPQQNSTLTVAVATVVSLVQGTTPHQQPQNDCPCAPGLNCRITLPDVDYKCKEPLFR